MKAKIFGTNVIGALRPTRSKRLTRQNRITEAPTILLPCIFVSVGSSSSMPSSDITNWE